MAIIAAFNKPSPREISNIDFGSIRTQAMVLWINRAGVEEELND